MELVPSNIETFFNERGGIYRFPNCSFERVFGCSFVPQAEVLLVAFSSPETWGEWPERDGDMPIKIATEDKDIGVIVAGYSEPYFCIHSKVDETGKTRFVNSSLNMFLRFLGAYRVYSEEMASVDDEQRILEYIDHLREELLKDDAPALEEDCWWSLVFQQMYDGNL